MAGSAPGRGDLPQTLIENTRSEGRDGMLVHRKPTKIFCRGPAVLGLDYLHWEIFPPPRVRVGPPQRVAHTRFLCRYPAESVHPQASDLVSISRERHRSRYIRAFRAIGATASHARGHWFEPSRAPSQSRLR